MSNLPYLLTRVIGLLVLLWNIRLIRVIQRARIPGEMLLSAITLFLSIPFILSTSWPHYFVFLPFCQAALYIQIRSLHRNMQYNLIPALLISLSVILSSVFILDLFSGIMVYYEVGMLFLSNLLLLSALYLIVDRQRVILSKEFQQSN